MRHIICEKNQAPLDPPTAPDTICKKSLQPDQNNQSEPEGVSDGVSVIAPAHAAGISPPPACSHSVKLSIFSEQTQ